VIRGAKWTAEQKEEALGIYVASGPAEASRQTGIPAGLVSKWAQRAGMVSKAAKATSRATETAKANREVRKALLAEALLEDGEKLRKQLWAPAKVHNWGTVSTREGNATTTTTEWQEHEIAEPTFADKRMILQAVATAIDKSQLLAGEATSRSEQVSTTELEKALSDAIPDPAARRRLALSVLPRNVEGVGEARAG
jgi:hypothetical protein